MGQTDSKKKIEEEFQIFKIEQDGNTLLKSKKDSKQYLMRIVTCSCKADLDRLKALLECRAQLKNHHILSLVEIKQKQQDFVCSIHYKMYLVLEYSFNNLERQCKERSSSQDKNYFQENDLWSILYSCCTALNVLYSNGATHQSLTAQQIFINKDGFVKITEPLLFGLEKNHLQAMRTRDENIINVHLSPEIIGCLEDQNFFYYDKEKSDIFILAMIIVDIALLQTHYLYDAVKKKPTFDQIQHLLTRIGEKYSSNLVGILGEMLRIQSRLRPNLAQIIDRVEKCNNIGQDFTVETESNNKSNQFSSEKQQDKVHFEKSVKYQEILKEDFPFEQSKRKTGAAFSAQQKSLFVKESPNSNFEGRVLAVAPQQSSFQGTVIHYPVNYQPQPQPQLQSQIHYQFQPQPQPLQLQPLHQQIQLQSHCQPLHPHTIQHPHPVQYHVQRPVPTQLQPQPQLPVQQVQSPIQVQIQSQNHTKSNHINIQATSSFKTFASPSPQRKPQTFSRPNAQTVKTISNQYQNFARPISVTVPSQVKRLNIQTITPKKNQPLFSHQIPEIYNIIMSSKNASKIGNFAIIEPLVEKQSIQPQGETNKATIFHNFKVNREVVSRFGEEPQSPSFTVELKKNVSHTQSQKQTTSQFYKKEFQQAPDPFTNNKNSFSGSGFKPSSPYTGSPPYAFSSSAVGMYGGNSSPIVSSSFIPNFPSPSKGESFTCRSGFSHLALFHNNDEQDLKLQFVKEQIPERGRYEGYKCNEERNGHGSLYFKDGGHYQGEWKHDKMHGFGKLYYQNGKIAYEGHWQNDEFNGQGRVYNSQPVSFEQQFNYKDFSELGNKWTYYQGQFKNDSKHGKGYIKLTNGEMYEGIFDHDMIQGNGIFYKRTGEIIIGFWIDNKLFLNQSYEHEKK